MGTSRFNFVKKDFSGGEVSGRLFMRDDTEMYSRSCATMRNFYPTLQGSAVRTPGTRFFLDVGNLDARIIPMLSQANEETLLIITPATGPGLNDGNVEVIPDVLNLLGSDVSNADGPIAPNVPTVVYKNISKNNGFQQGLTDWWISPTQFTSNDGKTLVGAWLDNQAIQIQIRDWNKQAKDPKEAFVTQQMTVPEDSDRLQIFPSYRYTQNFSAVDGRILIEVSMGTTEFGNDIYYKTQDQTNFAIGSVEDTPVTISTNQDGSPLALTAGQTIYFTFKVTAIEDSIVGPSAPYFIFTSLRVSSLVTVEISTEAVGGVPYLAGELADIQYVQSPYPGTGGAGGKELVCVHPNHPPKRLRFNVANYIFEDIPFQDADDIESFWLATGYPATCTSFAGRLILAGSTTKPIPGSQDGSGSETVWGTESGNWVKFSDTVTDPTAETAIEFTAMYRSPIQWVYGQKNLLIGAQSLEYIASADGIFQPSDIGVEMHSAHGSVGVQPVALGDAVLYAAEGGTRVRAMSYDRQAGGYTSPDMTFWHPFLFNSSIVRAFRLRTPNQMAGFLMGSGVIAILSLDRSANVMAWSRIVLDAVIKDACVLKDSTGNDVLFITVRRIIEGVPRLYVEAFRNWTDFITEDYQQSGISYTLDGTNILTGLDHLEGQNVDVMADGNYLGVFTVEAGEIELVDQVGVPITPSSAVVGLPMSAKITTLPLVTQDPGSIKRFTEIEVRGIFSTQVLINGTRVPTRTPATPMNSSEPIDWFNDYKILKQGSTLLEMITLEENLPLRAEILGIFGSVKTSSAS